MGGYAYDIRLFRANDIMEGMLAALRGDKMSQDALAILKHIASAFVRAEPRLFAPVAKDHEGEWALVETKRASSQLDAGIR